MSRTSSVSLSTIETRFLYFILAAGCVLFASCGRDDRVPVFPVRGQVLGSKGKPAEGALVVFHPATRGSTQLMKPLGYVDERGNYELTTFEKGDGAPCGKYVITLEWRERTADPFSSNSEGRDRLRGRYNAPKTSEFTFTVEENSANTVPAIHVE